MRTEVDRQIAEGMEVLAIAPPPNIGSVKSVNADAVQIPKGVRRSNSCREDADDLR
jgi:hypothetical protein